LHKRALLIVIGAVGVSAFAPGVPASNAEDDARVIAQMGLREAEIPLRQMLNWHKPRKIVVAGGSKEVFASLLEAVVGSGVTLVQASNPTQLKLEISDADAMIGPCLTDVIVRGTKLTWVQAGVAGAEGCLTIPSIKTGTVLLTDLQRVNSAAVADHALALVLTLTRKIIPLTDAQRGGKWLSAPPAHMTTLQDKTMLIVGLGGVGTQIAQRAHAFGMHVIGIRNTGKAAPDYVEHVGLPDELPALVEKADFIVNSTPLTQQTTDLFNARFFSRMKPSAMFFNVGRGGSVVTADLTAALQTGKIAGAGLDVVEPEPLPADHALWRMPNVVITPHVADSSESKAIRDWILIRENLRRFVEGGKLLSVVDVRRGY
jgi:phosphoglycerate dehydrogenase-like enzyme